MAPFGFEADPEPTDEAVTPRPLLASNDVADVPDQLFDERLVVRLAHDSDHLGA
jgi:hypothetical protein